jgi:hypothetical protein
MYNILGLLIIDSKDAVLHMDLRLEWRYVVGPFYSCVGLISAG